MLANHWKSDLEFYVEDLRFLHHLVDKYLLWITKPENLAMVKKIQARTFALKKDGLGLEAEITKHQKALGQMVEDPSREPSAEVNAKQGQLEEQFAHFVKRFRDNRKETFKITEYVIDSESLPPILER